MKKSQAKSCTTVRRKKYEDMLRRQREGQGVRRLSASGQVWGLEPGFVADEGEPDKTPPFVPFDNTANMTAIHAQWRRAYGGALASGSNVIVPPQEQPDQPAPFLSAAVQGVSAAMVSGTATLTLFPDWSPVLNRLDAIESALKNIAPFVDAVAAAYREHSRMGHNNPPEEMELLPLDVAGVQLGLAATNLARTEIKRDRPRFDVIRLCGLVLGETAKRLLTFLHWVEGKADAFAEAFVKSAGEQAGRSVIKWVIGGVAAVEVMQALHVDLNAAGEELHRIFEVLHLPL